MNERFTWIPLYKALSDWLLLGKDNQPELISILKDICTTASATTRRRWECTYPQTQSDLQATNQHYTGMYKMLILGWMSWVVILE